MENSYFQGALIALVALLFFFIFFREMPKARLKKAFRDLGNLKGKSKQEIISIAGKPNMIATRPTGQVLGWHAGGYHIQLLFDQEDQFVKIVQELQA